MQDEPQVNIDEVVVLSKYEGDPAPENEFERIHIHNGEIVAVERIEAGKVVERKEKEVE